jgi:hypothetical protein
MMLDTDSEFRVKLSNVSSYVSDLDVQRMQRADAFQHASEEETGPAALPNSNGDTSLATYASLATSIPSEQQQSIATLSPEEAEAVELNEAWTKFHEQQVTQLEASNMQAERPVMPTQPDRQMRHSLLFPAYPTKDDTLRGIDELLEFLQVPTNPIDLFEDRNIVSAIMQNLRGRYCNGVLEPAEAKALNSGLQYLYEHYVIFDRKEMTYWAVSAISMVMQGTPERYSYPHSGDLAIANLRVGYGKFLGHTRRHSSYSTR